MAANSEEKIVNPNLYYRQKINCLTTKSYTTPYSKNSIGKVRVLKADICGSPYKQKF